MVIKRKIPRLVIKIYLTYKEQVLGIFWQYSGWLKIKGIKVNLQINQYENTRNDEQTSNSVNAAHPDFAVAILDKLLNKVTVIFVGVHYCPWQTWLGRGRKLNRNRGKAFAMEHPLKYLQTYQLSLRTPFY